MDIRIIVFGMCFVLAALFIGAKFFVPYEKSKSQNEAAYLDAAKAFFANPSQETYKVCLEVAKSLPHLKNKSEDEVITFLSQNKIELS